MGGGGGILKIAAESVIGSLSRYGDVIMGNCMPPDLIRKIDTQVINEAARRICGAGRAKRIETLHFITDCHSFKNRYVVRCAFMLDSILRATNSGIRDRILAELHPLRHVESLETRMQQIEIPGELILRSTTSEFLWN